MNYANSSYRYILRNKLYFTNSYAVRDTLAAIVRKVGFTTVYAEIVNKNAR